MNSILLASHASRRHDKSRSAEGVGSRAGVVVAGGAEVVELPDSRRGEVLPLDGGLREG